MKRLDGKERSGNYRGADVCHNGWILEIKYPEHKKVQGKI